MDIRCYNRQALKAFIDSDFYAGLEDVPISVHRAVSHIHNPNTNADDILLIASFEGDQLVGYLGILPDKIHYSSENTMSCGWLSCLWVHRDHRGKQIALNLIRLALDCWQERILLTNFVPSILKIYNKTGAFGPPCIMEGNRWYLKMSLHILLPPKHQFFKLLTPVLKSWDTLFNFFGNWRFRVNKRMLKGYTIQAVHSIDDNDETLIEAYQAGKLFKRSREELNWILKYPWILKEPPDTNTAGRYYFSDYDSSFQSIAYKVFSLKGELIGWVMLVLHKGHLKVPYCFFKDAHIDQVARSVISYLYELKPLIFSVFHEKLAEKLMQHSLPSLYSKRIEQKYLISKSIIEKLQGREIFFSEGDGDGAFT